MPGVLALHWPAWSGYLLPAVLPKIAGLRIVPGESAEAVAQRIVERRRPPRLVILHIDASRPRDFVGSFGRLGTLLAEAGIALWNGRIGEIGKNNLQRSLLSLGLPAVQAGRDGTADERVIVKTDLNSHGSGERQATHRELAALGWGPQGASPLDRHDYPVMVRAKVPSAWWSDASLSIERYIDNPLGLVYRAYFAGPQAVLCEGRAPGPLRRLRDATDRYDFLLDRATAADSLLHLLLGSPAAEVFRTAAVFAQTCGLDYGSLDLVVDEAGVPFIIDLNLTPYWGRVPGAATMLRHLRRGPSCAARETSVPDVGRV